MKLQWFWSENVFSRQSGNGFGFQILDIVASFLPFVTYGFWKYASLSARQTGLFAYLHSLTKLSTESVITMAQNKSGWKHWNKFQNTKIQNFLVVGLQAPWVLRVKEGHQRARVDATITQPYTTQCCALKTFQYTNPPSNPPSSVRAVQSVLHSDSMVENAVWWINTLQYNECTHVRLPMQPEWSTNPINPG